MTPPLLVDTTEASSEHTDLATDINLLLKRWIHETADYRNNVTLHVVDGETEEFLFDSELDGMRVILIRPRPPVDRPQLLLSPREREIARMVAKGYPNKTIAAVLDISTWTVCTYLRRIFAKLSVCSRAAMVARLSEKGLLADESEGEPPFRSRRK